MSVPTVRIRDSGKIPQIGLGLWKITDNAQFTAAFQAAIEAGYRHFDSAQAYGNEQLLGKAWQESGIARNELFLTTKIAVNHFSSKRTSKSFKTSLEKLETNYVDLLLLHFPVSLLRKKAWLELETLHKNGVARAIGVSNYTIRHLEEMKQYASIMPAVNQVELHVFLQQPELLEYCNEHSITVEAYSPLAHARAGADSVLLGEFAAKYQKTYTQIMLRWCIQKGLVVLPKSVTPSRIRENIAVFDFEIDDEDMKRLASLNRNLRTCWNPTLVP